MKHKNYLTLVLGALLISMPLVSFAQQTRLSAKVERATLAAQDQAQQLREATVTVTATLKKPVKMSDVMFRPVRGGRDQVISYETKKHTCQGTLDQSGKRVYISADCVNKKGFTLSSVKLHFANGKVATGTKRAVYVQKEIAYVSVSPDVTRGLRGLACSKIPALQNLQKTLLCA